MDEYLDEDIRYALIVKKFYLGKGPNFEDIYMFRPIEMLYGLLDEDNITLINDNGREYYPIDSLITEEVNTDEAYIECFNIDELYSIFHISTQQEIYNYYQERLMNLVYIGVDHMPDNPGTFFDLKELKKTELVEYGENNIALTNEKAIVPLAQIHEILETNDVQGLKDYFSSLEKIKGNAIEAITQKIKESLEEEKEPDKESHFTEEEKKDLGQEILEDAEEDVKLYERRKEIIEAFENESINYETPREKIKRLRKVLKETVIGQESAIDLMCYAIYKNLKLPDGEKRTSPLLIGPTGAGKTLMLETIEKELKIPTVIVDANTLSTTGYVGKNITDYISSLLDKANGNVTVAEHGIFCIDEIDKKGSKDNEDVGGKGVINQALKFIEGCTYDIEYVRNGRKQIIHFDTRNLTVCLSGAFPEIYEQKMKEIMKNTIGFNANIRTTEEREEDVYRNLKITKEDVAKIGQMGPEFAGRVLIVTFKKPTVEDLIEQMETSKTSELTNEIKVLESDNIIFDYNPAFVRKIAEDAHKQGTGGRAVRDIIEQTFSGIVTKIVFDDDSYDEYKDYHIFGYINEDGELSIISETGEELIERKEDKKEEKKGKTLTKTNDNV